MKRTEHPSADAVDAPAPPRFGTLIAAGVYAACAFSLAWPTLLGRVLLSIRSDQYIAGYAFREFAAQYLRAHGAFPQWNPYQFGGMPYIAAMHGDIFYPTFLLRLVMPTDLAMTWGMIGHFLLCGFATWWFLHRTVRLSYYASLLGGVAYMMGGFVSSLVSAGHDGKLFVNALLPVTLIVLTSAMRDGKRWAWGALALVIGLAILTPHPQLFQYLLLVSAAWAIFLAFRGEGGEKLRRDVALKRLAMAFAAVVVGSAIGAIQYLPVAEYAKWSPRAAGLGAAAMSYSFPAEELINTWLPQFSGLLDNYWGRNGIHFHSEYVGAVVLVLAGAAFGAGWGAARKRFFNFWLLVGAISLLWALGGSTPFFNLILAVVPGTKYFRAPSTMFFVTTFAIAVCAALGTERLLTGRLSARYAYGWLIAGAAASLFAFAGGFGVIAQNLARAPELAEVIDQNAGAVRLGALRSLLFTALACGGILALGRKQLSATMVAWLLVAVAILDLWTIERLYWGYATRASKLYASDATIEYLKAHGATVSDTGPARVIAAVTPSRVIALSFRNPPPAPNDPFLGGAALMVHGIRQTLGYHGNELGRYRFFEVPEMIANPSFWAFNNADYFLINSDSVPFAKATRVAGPTTNAAGTRVSLFKLEGEHPFAWVAPAIAKYPDESIQDALRTPVFPVRNVALIDPASPTPAVTLAAAPPELPIKVSVSVYEPGHAVMELSAPAPQGSALVVSENYYPGWRATVDGKPATAERANLTLVAVALPAGARKVELTFSSDAYARGKVITLIALFLTLLAMVGGALSGRRTAPEPKS